MRSAIAAFAVLSCSAFACAVEIPAGYDLFFTDTETSFNFGPGIGIVNFAGNPLSPGTLGPTDTIIQRTAAAVFNGQGSSSYPASPAVGTEVTIPIEMVALSLVSVAPVQVGSSFFDVFITLDTAIPSLGTMTVGHEWDDVGQFQGTFDSTLNVFADAVFRVAGGGPPAFTIDIDNLALASTDTLWAHEPYGFYVPLVIEQHPGVGVHVAHGIPAPAPSLVGLLAAVPLLSRRRRTA